MIQALEPIRGPMPQTQEWHDARCRSIGASEAAAACGLSPYAQPIDLYMEKRGLVPPRESNDAMRLGLLLEPIVLAEYETRTNSVTQRPVPTLYHPEHPFISATPDAMNIDPGTFPVDAKTSTWRMAHHWGEEGTDEIPEPYVLQAQQQMYVTGCERCDMAVLLDGRTLKVYTVARHERLIELLVAAETELWQHIQDCVPPPIQFSHPRVLETVKALYKIDEGETVDLPPEMDLAWGRYRELRETIKEAEAEQDRIKARVLAEMKDAAIGRLDGLGVDLVRAMQSRKEYVVKATTFTTLRERKVKR